VDRGHDSAKRRKRRREHADAADCAHTHTLSIRSQLVAGGFMGPGCARRRGAQPRALRFQPCQPLGDDRLGSKQLKRGPGTHSPALYCKRSRLLQGRGTTLLPRMILMQPSWTSLSELPPNSGHLFAVCVDVGKLVTALSSWFHF
jgi:hypothetical protein